MKNRVPISEVRRRLTGLVRAVERGKRHPLVEALRTWRESLPADFKGISRREVDWWRDRSPPRKAQFP